MAQVQTVPLVVPLVVLLAQMVPLVHAAQVMPLVVLVAPLDAPVWIQGFVVLLRQMAAVAESLLPAARASAGLLPVRIRRRQAPLRF